MYRKKGPLHYSEAERYMREALKLNADDAELHGMLGGLSLKRKEDYWQALAHYRRAHELEAENLYALVNMGGISCRRWEPERSPPLVQNTPRPLQSAYWPREDGVLDLPVALGKRRWPWETKTGR